MTVQTYQVSGMTCEHCERAVRAEVTALPGVESAQVDLASGRLVITSPQPLAHDQVVAAVDEAGYVAVPA